MVTLFANNVKTGAVYSLSRRPPSVSPPLLDERVAWLCEQP
ncbi:hypothetical protein [Erwinia rhapontici]|nr:hypothetical protein [Erwinia rhapontici]